MRYSKLCITLANSHCITIICIGLILFCSASRNCCCSKSSRNLWGTHVCPVASVCDLPTILIHQVDNVSATVTSDIKIAITPALPNDKDPGQSSPASSINALKLPLLGSPNSGNMLHIQQEQSPDYSPALLAKNAIETTAIRKPENFLFKVSSIP